MFVPFDLISIIIGFFSIRLTWILEFGKRELPCCSCLPSETLCVLETWCSARRVQGTGGSWLHIVHTEYVWVLVGGIQGQS